VEPQQTSWSFTPPALILLEATVLLNNKAEVRFQVRHAIAGVELIEDPEAMSEHMPLEVLGRGLASKGHVLVCDWRGMEIVANMIGL
jgi:hypothetical protein